MKQNNENFDSRTMVEENNKITQEKEKKNLKESLALVFDDDFSTKAPKWNSIPDYIIIGVIILSTIEVFLSTFNVVVEHLGSILKIIDWFTVIFFTRFGCRFRSCVQPAAAHFPMGIVTTHACNCIPRL